MSKNWEQIRNHRINLEGTTLHRIEETEKGFALFFRKYRFLDVGEIHVNDCSVEDCKELRLNINEWHPPHYEKGEIIIRRRE